MTDDTKRPQWSKKAKVQFIELYKEHTCLWDTNHPKYHDRDANEEALFSIRNELLDLIPELTIADIKRRRKNLQTQHSAEVRELKQNKKRTPTLWCYDLLYFLRGEEPKNHSLDDLNESQPHKNVSYKRVFNKQLTVKLIDEYKKHDVLWNRHHKEYKNQNARMEALVEIWKSFDDSNIRFIDIKKKINNLRTTFSNEHRMFLCAQKHGEDWQSKSGYYSQLAFLMPHYRHRTYMDMDEPMAVSEEESTEEFLTETKSSAIEDEEQIIEADTMEVLSDELVLDLVEYLPEATEAKKSEKRFHIVENDLEDECVQQSKIMRKESNQVTKRFAWLGEKLVDTLNNLHNEEIICELAVQVQKLLEAALAGDSLELCAAELSKFTSENYAHNTDLQVTITFDSKQKKFGEIMAAVGQLPAIQNIYLTGKTLQNK